MKRTLIIATLAIMSLFGTTACAQKKGENMNSLNNKKVLVAYFSWSGNTKAAADYITQKLNADQFEIVREADYPTDYDECANEAKAEKDANTHPAIKGTVSDMAQYDVVLVCVPCWWYTAPMPVFTFLEQYKDIVKATPKSDHRDGICVVTKEMNGVGMDKKFGQIDKWLKEIGF